MKPMKVTTTYDTIVGAELVRARDARGVSQVTLADRLNLNQSHLSRMEAGIIPITVTQLSLIARAIEESEKEILGGVERTLFRMKAIGVHVKWTRREPGMLTAKQINAMRGGRS